MPLYQSKTGKNVIVHLGRDKKKIMVSTTPTQLPYANLHKLFPKLVEKIKDDPMPVPDNILEQARQRLFKQQLDRQVFNEIERQIGTVVDYRNTQLQTRMWAGQRCFIVAGGPSLVGFDFNKLQGERVIAINKAFVDVPFADIQLSIDKQFYFWLTDPKKTNAEMRDAIVKWPDFQGHKVWVKLPGVDVLKGVECVKFAGNEGLSASLEDGIYAGSNSGYAAINLAVALGANPIYLLGYDMKHDAKGRTHYHGGYTKPQKTSQLQLFAKKFPKLAEEAKKRGVKIVNLNRNSALKCFEFGDVDGVLSAPATGGTNSQYSKKWRVISFYTKNTGYEEEIKKLEHSLNRFGLDYHLFAFPPKGSWRENLNYKSQCILEAFDMFPDQDIVFVDSDAIIRRHPLLFDQLSLTKEYTVAATFHGYSPQSGDPDELLSGTLWFANNQESRNLVMQWHQIGLDNPTIRHQKCLRHAIEFKKNVKLFRMPFEYTYIFDYKYPRRAAPVVEHFQASRKLRKQVGYGVPLIRDRRKLKDPIPTIKEVLPMPMNNIIAMNKKQIPTNTPKVSVVVVTYRRLQDLELILSSWLKETNDVWLCDCSKEGFKTNLPIKIVRATPDPGNKIRHAVATMTEGDLVIKADDDIVPLPGLVQDFITCYKEKGNCIMGIHGRIFNGPDYYNNTKLYGSKQLTQPFKVDFLGVITCSPRENLAMDLKGCGSAIEDLFWHNDKYHKIPKYIISSKNFRHLPTSKDEHRLCGDIQSRKIRREFYRQCYEKYYKK